MNFRINLRQSNKQVDGDMKNTALLPNRLYIRKEAPAEINQIRWCRFKERRNRTLKSTVNISTHAMSGYVNLCCSNKVEEDMASTYTIRRTKSRVENTDMPFPKRAIPFQRRRLHEKIVDNQNDCASDQENTPTVLGAEPVAKARSRNNGRQPLSSKQQKKQSDFERWQADMDRERTERLEKRNLRSSPYSDIAAKTKSGNLHEDLRNEKQNRLGEQVIPIISLCLYVIALLTHNTAFQ